MALAATLVGFGLLVVALITGTVWLAVACIAICIIGGVFLLADLLGLGHAVTVRRSRHAGATDSSDPDPTGEESDDTGRPVPAEAVRPADLSDAEITTEFPRVALDEPTVTLDDADSAWHTDIADSPAYEAAPVHRHAAPEAAGDDESSATPPVRHGRHESPEGDPQRPRTPRHGGS